MHIDVDNVDIECNMRCEIMFIKDAYYNLSNRGRSTTTSKEFADYLFDKYPDKFRINEKILLKETKQFKLKKKEIATAI